ncbi:MAG TPA: cyclodeaminase/cyclohydrolase family protein [Phycisphaerae bacterium]|nr:cyclodeaminase/cyclohydrolase family protein [Phycisphaerae bacterium]HPS53108.1 cyclodeaminase/cyclohydrolase family protein [Phycisphaerae bacterium]
MSDCILKKSVRDFVEATAAKQPTPGGGSVAGVVGALGTALGEMALNFTAGKKKFAEHEEYYVVLAERLKKSRDMFMTLVADDMAAFGMYCDASAMPESREKQQASELALAAAIDVPREMTKLCLAVLYDLKSLADKCNPWLISDLVAGGILAAATAGLCDLNVRINARNLENPQRDEILNASAADRRRAAAIAAEIEEMAGKLL